MVLMPVRDRDTADFVFILYDIVEIGDYKVDSRHTFIGERHAAINNKAVISAFIHGHVFADLAEAAKRDNAHLIFCGLFFVLDFAVLLHGCGMRFRRVLVVLAVLILTILILLFLRVFLAAMIVLPVLPVLSVLSVLPVLPVLAILAVLSGLLCAYRGRLLSAFCRIRRIDGAFAAVRRPRGFVLAGIRISGHFLFVLFRHVITSE